MVLFTFRWGRLVSRFPYFLFSAEAQITGVACLGPMPSRPSTSLVNTTRPGFHFAALDWTWVETKTKKKKSQSAWQTSCSQRSNADSQAQIPLAQSKLRPLICQASAWKYPSRRLLQAPVRHSDFICAAWQSIEPTAPTEAAVIAGAGIWPAGRHEALVRPVHSVSRLSFTRSRWTVQIVGSSGIPRDLMHPGKWRLLKYSYTYSYTYSAFGCLFCFCFFQLPLAVTVGETLGRNSACICPGQPGETLSDQVISRKPRKSP